MTDWIEGTVADAIHWTGHLFTLKIYAEVAPFKAGQFTSLALDIDGERIARPYSYLSPPGQQPLEFFFYAANGGVLSNALLALRPGDPIWIRQHANGFFTLDEVPDARDLWLLGTGTGVAPYYSIVRTTAPWQRFDTVVIVNAVRNRSDLQYLDLVDTLKAEHGERFRFQAFVSREPVPGTLPGRIPAALQDGSLESAVDLQLDPAHSQIMLCGNPAMVADSIEVLKQRGFRKNRRRTPGQLTTENYW